MLPYFILGIALLAGLLLVGRWFVNADPKVLLKTLKWLSIIFILGVIISLAVTGRLAWAVMALPALLPWIMRARAVHRAARNFSRMSGMMGGGQRGGTGQTSEVETRFLKMTLDHDTGAMVGEVVEGAYSGRNLDELAIAELVDLLNTCILHDTQSAQVLEAYMDRVHPDWRERVQAAGTGTNGNAGGQSGSGQGGGGMAGTGTMTRDEALQVLGLEPGATDEEIKSAYHRLIGNLHPDHGGSTYLAAKINQAKDVLLRS
ncbi:MAG: DnaJ domain-containing protein [Rhodospirillales bacterium]|nr:DnaJ domain-containing protein [Rhodospirillales bacterium]